MGVMYVQDRSGHATFGWDMKNRASVRSAAREFDKLRAEGRLLYRAEPGSEDGELMRVFDPAVEEIVVAPRNVGG